MAALTGCDDNSSSETEVTSSVRFATYNLSFDRASYEILVDQMELTPEQQDKLVEQYENNPDGVTSENQDTAKKVIQIRNVAEVIQRTNPDVFVLAEFNNDGTGEDTKALEGFQKNYLSVAQDESLEGIEYQYQKSFATNTGLESGYDLNQDGLGFVSK
ncbi:endonuclease/exonuclease/phosphatase family protein [Endozoicomonas arenosclerae]|uniref:endonuclease/exonuclease/phosphatase family protein n=1 Tax=Endozoicomonas arenosclerae TaxID=1633495 RepID=UPI0007821F5F|nr:endonuclease/exonuclease/phosphatase family protein [Endozoicomonas arenosclerae]